MRKISLATTAALIAVLTIVSCKKNNDIISTPGYAEFGTPQGSKAGPIAAYPSTSNTYMIPNSPNSQFKIPVGFTNISNVDRVITFKDSSRTAVKGVQYNFVNSITIPAGKAADSIVINGIFSGYPAGRKDTLYIVINGGDAPINAYNNVYALTLQSFCPVIASELQANYTKTRDYDGSLSGTPSAALYTTQITNWTDLSSTSARITIKNFCATEDIGFGPFDPSDGAAYSGITATLDWSNTSNLKVTIPSQSYMVDAFGYGPATISGSGTFSPCSQTFTITSTVKVSAGAFTPVVTVMSK